MKETTTSPAKAALPYGVLFGIIMVLEFVAMQVWKPDPAKYGWVGVVTNLLNFLILPALLVSLACNNYKNKINGGYISFSECLKSGVSVTVLAGFIYAVFYFIYYLIFPEFIDETMQQIKEITIKQKPDITAEELKMSLSIIEKTMQPYIAGPISIVMYAFIGLIISLIVGAVVKKENPGAFN